MAVVMRGWSRTASTAVKLATAERIIGYPFKDVDRLYEALDQKKRTIVLPERGTVTLRPRNTRLALVGDAHAKLYMAQKWYDNKDLTGLDWSEIAMSTLSNSHLGELGFKLGLDECAIPNRIENQYDMASTVEAIFAAVEMDGAGLEQLHKVMVRFGLQHKLVDPVQRAWIYHAVKSKLNLPDRFFIGHHLKLQEGVFETQVKRSTGQGEKTRDHFRLLKGIFETPMTRSTARRQRKRSRGRANSFWRRIKKSWGRIKWMLRRPRGNPERKIPANRQRPVRESATWSPKIVKPLVEGPPPTVTETINAASKDVATSETNILSKESLSRSEDDGRAAVREEATDREDPAEATESLRPEVNTPSQPSKPQPQPVVPNEDTSADDTRTAASDSQDSNKASTDAPAQNPPAKDNAVSGAEMDAERQPHEAPEAEPVEVTEAGDSPEKSKQLVKKLENKYKKLGVGISKMELAFHELNLANKKKTPEQDRQLYNLKFHRKRIAQRLLMLEGKLGGPEDSEVM